MVVTYGELNSAEQEQLFKKYFNARKYSDNILRCVNRAICLGLEEPEIECILQLQSSSGNETEAVNNMYYQLCNLVDNRNKGNRLVFDETVPNYGLNNVHIISRIN